MIQPESNLDFPPKIFEDYQPVTQVDARQGRRAAVPDLCQYPMFLVRLGLALSEKQVPQVDGNTEEARGLLEPLESVDMHPRQARYQAALRPDITCRTDSKALFDVAASLCVKLVAAVVAWSISFHRNSALARFAHSGQAAPPAIQIFNCATVSGRVSGGSVRPSPGFQPQPTRSSSPM